MHRPNLATLIKGITLSFSLTITWLCPHAQLITARFDRDRILIGDHATLTLQVVTANDLLSNSKKGFELPDSIPHLIIVGNNRENIELHGKLQSIKQTVTITSFDTGTWQIPPIPITFENGDRMQTDSIPLTILPINLNGLKEVHTIKGIIETKPETYWGWWQWSLASTLLLGLVYGLWYFMGKLKAQKQSAALIKKISPTDALQQLRALDALIEKGEYEAFLESLRSILLGFTESRYGVDPTAKTTREYLSHLLEKTGEAPNHTPAFKGLLLYDAVKFAQYKPSKTECKEALKNAMDFITQPNHPTQT